VSQNDLPPHGAVADTVAALRLGVDASELHGALCGFLCGGGNASPRSWLQQLALEPADGGGEVLAALFDRSCAQLMDPELGFELLLPDAELPLGQRADALIAWVRGFLGGFGLASGEAPALSEDAAEALQDLSAIASAQLSVDDPDNDEESLTEIVEFVRVAALLLQGERQPPRPAASRLH
jgi:uncharacterized protein